MALKNVIEVGEVHAFQQAVLNMCHMLVAFVSRTDSLVNKSTKKNV